MAGAESGRVVGPRADRPNQLGRRAALVDAAFACIAEHGFEGLRLRIVASRAGIDHSTLHHYFASKEDLVAAVVDDVTRQLAATVEPGLEPGEQLRRHLASVARMIRTRPELFTVAAELDLRARRDPALGKTLAREQAGWRAMLVDVLQRGREQRLPWAQGVDPDTAVDLILAAVKGARLAPDRAEAVLDQLARLLTAAG